jgi:hypothetical protein
VHRCLPADGVAGDAEVEDSREVAEAFLAAEVVFREEVAVSPEVREVFPEVAGAFLAVAVSLGAAVFLAAAAVVSPEAETVFPAVVAAGFPEAAIVFPTEAAAVPLVRIAFRTILHCTLISADRDRLEAECHRVQSEVNLATVVYRWEEAPHNYLLEIDPRKFPLGMKAASEHVRVQAHPSDRAEAMPAIFSASLAGLGLALRLARRPQAGLINFPRIVSAAVNRPLLHSNAQIGTRVR